ncbi:LptA/OstA family protein [Pararhodobacter aggregans]|uniref:Lipopolysaccharide transport periplasmic protein LptA n=1 Tax=Pararhodobacter aggregans TaxID=404875 RepID=A0A2T7UU35_9RHOB|nr:LptA/OstA family protein [Pararhodobacter aggregans]PTX02869.1 lipopolysaccharide export system protein LptA [Pararhodobacter aggregans]PVE48088.1 lipopolysaccharide transport periplasmic protein LptA [Pararhodobacter aggregans]
MPRLFLRLLAVLMLAALPASAQEGVQISFGQSLRLEGSALEVTADLLTVDQTTGASEFSGNVLAVQGDMRISAGALRLEYAAGAREGQQRISRLVASGGVTMSTPSEALESREAVYSLDAQSLEMTGAVMLVQGENLLSGERFVADLRAGTGRMVGRVRTIIRME